MSSSKGTIPSLNDDIYIRILQFATESPSPVYGMDEHVPQETLAACMRVSKVCHCIDIAQVLPERRGAELSTCLELQHLDRARALPPAVGC
jgi:hypothetical protein